MRWRRRADDLLLALVVSAAVVMLVGHALGQPILLGFVTTDSMEPTLDAGDGFVAVPQPIGGDVEEGDVVVFRAEELHGGGLVTHRVVDETEEGYVTKGDANPFTDQDGPEPHVGEDRIVASALRVDGDAVVVPHLGTAVDTAHDVGAAVQVRLFGSGDSDGGDPTDGNSDAGGVGGFLVAVGGALLLATLLLDRVGAPRRERRRSRRREGIVDVRLVATVLLLLVLVPANAAMLGPAGAHSLGLASAENPAQDPYAVAPGETGAVDVPIHNDGVAPVLVILSGGNDRTTADDRLVVRGGTAERGTLSVAAPETVGQFDATLVERRYLLVLPPPLLAGLHAIDPRLALLAVNLAIVGVALVVLGAVLGFGRVRIRSTGVRLAVRIRRLID